MQTGRGCCAAELAAELGKLCNIITGALLNGYVVVVVVVVGWGIKNLVWTRERNKNICIEKRATDTNSNTDALREKKTTWT